MTRKHGGWGRNALCASGAAASIRFLGRGKGLDKEMRNRASYPAKELAVFTAEHIITGSGFALYKKVSPPLTASEELLSGSSLHHLMIYNHNCEMLIGNTAAEIFCN